MSPDVPLEVRMLQALGVAGRFLAMRAAPPRDALETAARAHGVDVGELAILLLSRLIERERARSAIAADSAHAPDA